MDETLVLQMNHRRKLGIYSSRKLKTKILTTISEKYIKKCISYPFFQSIKNKFIEEGGNCLTQLIQALLIKYCDSEDYLFKVSDPIDSLFIILKGKVIEKRISNNSPIIRSKGYVFTYPSHTQYETEAICLNTCNIGVISLSIYNSIIQSYDSIEKSTELKFLMSLYPLCNANIKTIENIYEECQMKRHAPGSIIIKEGKPMRGLYIIRKGQFELSKKHHSNITKDIDVDIFNQSSLSSCQSAERFSTIRRFELKDSYKETKKFKIMILGIGDFLGDIEIKNKHTQASYFTVRCLVNESIVYRLSYKHFNELFVQNIAYRFNEGVQLKQNTLRSRLLFLSKKKAENTINKYNDLVLKKLKIRAYSNENCKASSIVNKEQKKMMKPRLRMKHLKEGKSIIKASFQRTESTKGQSKNLFNKKFDIHKTLQDYKAKSPKRLLSSYQKSRNDKVNNFIKPIETETQTNSIKLNNLKTKQMFLYTQNKVMNTNTVIRNIKKFFPFVKEKI